MNIKREKERAEGEREKWRRYNVCAMNMASE